MALAAEHQALAHISTAMPVAVVREVEKPLRTAGPVVVEVAEPLLAQLLHHRLALPGGLLFPQVRQALHMPIIQAREAVLPVPQAITAFTEERAAGAVPRQGRQEVLVVRRFNLAGLAAAVARLALVPRHP